ncbi:MAG: hypothetical protein ACYC7F_07365, partial [Gemmatimonadaceae bacterium]
MIENISSGGSRRRNRHRLALLIPVLLLAAAACSQDLPLAPERAGVGTPRVSNVSGSPTIAPHVSAGGLHTCALKTDGTVVCWGWNPYGQATVPSGLTSVA